MHTVPYLFFEGRCEEALAFYGQALGAETRAMMRYRDSPEPAQVPPGNDDKVMHGEFKVGETVIFCSDGMCSGKTAFGGFGLALAAKDAAEAGRLFAALSDGGEVRMPLSPTFFSPAFGMVSDRFGVMWMVMAGQG
ncbi:VOC family protein [Falsiroseomonas sp. HW251]|uniref:VOC family protein n=1 Tax=Falsiroseomonas sp. HW251 TaxID=3390998 RepID=UPI003D316F7A